MKNSTLNITRAAIIAALYVMLTYLSFIFGLSSNAVQIRLSEMLTILPAFTISAVPGLFIGCLLSNILTGATVIDIIFGSVATLIGAFGTYLLGKKSKFLAPLPPVIANTVIIPFVLHYSYNLNPLVLFFLTVFLGEFVSCYILGIPFYMFMKKNSKRLGLK